jgi:small glutamine-rich tetratricopeptide repeat-containing protein alpha
MPASESKRALAASICDYLQQSLKDGDIDAAHKAGIEQSIDSIAQAFNTSGVKRGAVGLEQIFAVYERTQQRTERKPATDGAEAAEKEKEPSAEDVKAAESFKSLGNAAMTKKDYKEAVAQYTKALDLVPRAKVYLSNRAAAYSSLGEHEAAIRDARKACDVDPKYGKAWSRLGHALFVSGDLQGARKAYEQGCEVDPTSEIMKRGLETCTRKLEESGATSATRGPGGAAGGMPDLSALSGMFGNAGAGAGPPDIAAMMNNPAFMSMAQNMMQSGALEGLMNNPLMARMTEQMQNGGGMPDVSAMMQDPEIRSMAEGFGRSMGLDPEQLRRQQQERQQQQDGEDP